MEAYEDADPAETSTEESPWYVIPADNKWFTRVVVAAAVIAEAFWKLKLAYPQVDEAKKKDLAAARKGLMGEKQ